MHPTIPNPDFEPDEELYLQRDMGLIGIEIWQVKSGSLFDSIIVTDDLEEAQEFAKETWAKDKDGEKAAFDGLEKERKAKEEEERKKREEESRKAAEEKAKREYDEKQKGGATDEEEDDDEDDDDSGDADAGGMPFFFVIGICNCFFDIGVLRLMKRVSVCLR